MTFYTSTLKVGFLLITLFVFVVPKSSLADDYEQFALAKNAFEAGEYQEAVKRFNELLESGMKNPALVLETHKLIAVSYLFVDDREMAERHFTELLMLAPDYSLDPMIFPMSVVDFFTVVKQKNRERLEALARAKAAEEQKRLKREEAARKAQEEERIRNVYISRSTERKSIITALVPFGVGQFQNGDKLKGGLFLGGELLLAATALTTFILHETLRKDAKEPIDNPEKITDLEKLEAGYRITNQASLIALGVVAVIGIVDSLFHYQAETVSWEELEEQNVPGDLKQKAKKKKISMHLQLDGSTFGMGITGRF